MHRQTPIAQVLYNYLYPRPTPQDPPTFSAHLARNLVPEVRIEVATFYGDLNSTEARYPGLNYCHPPHRMRLGRFKHHRRLFDAFDNLGLTYHEIQEFCCWEGTRWARERFEKDEGIKVLDTTGDEIGPWVDRRELHASMADKNNNNTSSEPIPTQQARAILFNDSDTIPSQHHEIELLSEHEETDSDLDTDASNPPPQYHHPSILQAISNHNTTYNILPTTRPNPLSDTTSQRPTHTITHRILAAWERDQHLTPEMEQLLKEQYEMAESAAFNTTTSTSNPAGALRRAQTGSVDEAVLADVAYLRAMRGREVAQGRG